MYEFLSCLLGMAMAFITIKFFILKPKILLVFGFVMLGLGLGIPVYLVLDSHIFSLPIWSRCVIATCMTAAIFLIPVASSSNLREGADENEDH